MMLPGRPGSPSRPGGPGGPRTPANNTIYALTNSDYILVSK